jgi:hypothetical protein
MFWITLVHDYVGRRVTLFHGEPPREGIDETGAVELRLLGAADDLDAALGVVESLNALLSYQRPRRREVGREARSSSKLREKPSVGQ